jgi:hypothetical protein
MSPSHKSVLPKWLRVMWLCAAPFALLFATRIAWEKTFLPWARGPQMVGFSLMHIHPVFFLIGALCSYWLLLWLAIAIVFMAKGRIMPPMKDMLMVALCLFVLVALIVPDQAFA